jgi:hypothetical protein
VPARTPAASGPVGGITEAQIDRVIQQANAIMIERSNGDAGAGLTPPQVTTLRSVLSSPTGRQVMSPETPEGSTVHLSFIGNGGVSIQFYNGSTLVLDAAGTVKVLSTPPPFVPFTTSTRPIAALVVTGVALLVLAVLLAAAGILTLLRSSRARRLHWIYVWSQIPLALAAGACFAYVTFGMTNDRAAGAGVPGLFGYPSRISWDDAVSTAAQLTALSCIYPMSLLVLLNTRAVRNYYQPTARGE